MRIRKRYIKGPVYFTIAASVRSPDLRALAISAGWQGYEAIYCTINAGVDVATLVIQNLPDYLLTLQNFGRIGGVLNGGTALSVRSKTILINSGVIFGGGGKGGSGASKYIYRGASYAVQSEGGSGGDGAGFSPAGAVLMLERTFGVTGTQRVVGGPAIGGSSQGTATGGRGGDGGIIGASGTSGSYGTTSGTFDSEQDGTPAPGAAAGFYIDGDSNVQWLLKGDVRGRAI